jgi:hypothetical protein
MIESTDDARQIAAEREAAKKELARATKDYDTAIKVSSLDCRSASCFVGCNNVFLFAFCNATRRRRLRTRNK